MTTKMEHIIDNRLMQYRSFRVDEAALRYRDIAPLGIKRGQIVVIYNLNERGVWLLRYRVTEYVDGNYLHFRGLRGFLLNLMAEPELILERDCSRVDDEVTKETP